MSARQPRFEVVHSDAGWFVRLRARNGRKVWQTEVYARHGAAMRALEILDDAVWGTTEVREVDERGTS